MALNVISLYDMLRSIPTEEDNKSPLSEASIKELLLSFKTLDSQDSAGADDVQYFLHEKSIQFEKMDLARTYLVMSTYRSKPVLVGYFSISNKPLTLPNKQFRRLSNSVKKRLMGLGYKSEQSSYIIKGYLLGQLGKNFSEEARLANCCNGNDLLQIAYKKIAEAHQIVGGRVLYLECENVAKIIDFYKSNGFSQLDGFESENGYCMMVKQLKDIL
ncbi:GNAT family acetyltransferase [Paenibacillus xylanilyticus]|uniref:GNAT family acetyltransferase n=1 Tax=Paenibacillus xylanilyticus TaxID=248903 RepID=UPI00129E3C72|nr:GNAT family acetyltransferase [Paenibacillus xylanilyticus]